MKTRGRHSDMSQAGFTLLELLVGITIAVIVTAAAFTALTSSSKATRVNDQTAQTQQNARVAMELLSHDIKMAGYGMVGPVGNCGTAIVPSDNNSGGGDAGPDSISMVVPTTISALSNNLVAPFGAASNPVKLVSAAGFSTGFVISIGGVTSASVSAIATNDLTLSSVVGAPAVFLTSTPVYLLQCVTYQVIRPSDANAAICGGNSPCLARGTAVPLLAGKIDCNGVGGSNVCMSVADGIEDLQLAYACDGCNTLVNGGVRDRVIDDQGVTNNAFDAGDFVSDSNWALAPMTPDAIRLVLVSIVARETGNEQGFGEGNVSMVNSSGPVIVQDHNPSSDTGYALATYQRFRRRLVTRTVEVRNIGL